MTTDTIQAEDLTKIYKKVDELVNKYIGKISINDIEDSSEDDDNSNDGKTLEQKTEEKLKKTFLKYLLSDVDFFKVFILLLLAPNGLTKNDIALYLMDGKYKTKTDKNGNELSPEDQIKKNVNYIEKNVAHLASLLYLFYPNERDALEIVPKRDETRAKTIRYKFRNSDAARKMFSWLINFEGEIQSYAKVTQKQRNDIAEQCIEYVLKDVDSHSDIPDKNYRNNLKSIIKAIQNKTLCKLSYGYDYGEDDAEDDIDEDCIFFLPLMIRDATAKEIDWNLFLEDRNSDQDSLFKYLKMLDTESDYVVFGLSFLEPYKGENSEWYRSAETDCISLNMIGNISLTKHNLTDKGLELSEFYKTATHPIYSLNPYRNLCGEDFYLLLPKEFYKKIPSEIRTTCFNFQFDKLGSPEEKSIEWIESCGEILSQANYILMWDEDDLEGFNLNYYDKNTEYSLVKCKNYVDLLNRLNQAHILLPDNTLPRELVDRQRFMFVKSFIRKDFIASPHLVQQYEKRLNLNFYDITPSAEVYKESASKYELNRLRTYLSKFKYHYLEEMLYCQISPDIFCKAICNIDVLDENYSKLTTRGIPLSIYQQGNEHYLIFWNYLKQFDQLEDKKGKKLTWENSRACIEFANEFILDSDPTTNGLLDINAKINLELKTIPLCKVVNIQCMESTLLGVRAQNNLKNYLKKELKVTTNPRIDDITKISRTYYFSFDSDEFLRSLYLPDSFTNVKAYKDIKDFLYDSSNAIPDVVRSSLSLKEDEYIAQNHSLSFIRFETYKRSDVIRFLHEHMGRVFYLDTSEFSEDPLRIIEELSYDCNRQTSAVPSMWETLGTF
ncbi:hypothetical protein [Succinivibrio dextrinosolvens]|uniref:hypothetical protein n=1 Tax=Succinivibrio dextrinosolvens TaxID=83771 RepID=UPI001924B71E|nr:hypothetical protein [Succinivibrio dextrinosolvens]